MTWDLRTEPSRSARVPADELPRRLAGSSVAIPWSDRVVGTPRWDAKALDIAGSRVHLLSQGGAMAAIIDHAISTGADDPALAVASANLDHLHHFGARSTCRGRAIVNTEHLRWMTLIDGAPIAMRARHVSGRNWPRLAGSDLLLPLLQRATEESLSVGFLGGTLETLERLRDRLMAELPALMVAGLWSPTRREVEDEGLSREIAEKIRAASTDILVVGLGKPRQEIWIQKHSETAGARVLLAFGASTDFLAGTIKRAPDWVRRSGMEWGYRLVNEPKRMWRRYLIQGPPAFAQLRMSTFLEPGPTHSPSTAPERQPTPTNETHLGSVIIPAHNEGTVISRMLDSLRDLIDTGDAEVVVAANGCTDDTATKARSVPGITVLELTEASKTAALNAADSCASAWPRLYLDADVTITSAAIRDTLAYLAEGRTLVARPTMMHDTTASSAVVRAYYRARGRIPEMNGHLWGAGAYAMTRSAHERLQSFPDVTADDFYVDTLFLSNEKAIVETQPVIVYAPHRREDLLRIMRRSYRGNRELMATGQLTRDECTTKGVAIQLFRTIRGPISFIDALIYASVAIEARRTSARATSTWERDESSRVAA